MIRHIACALAVDDPAHCFCTGCAFDVLCWHEQGFQRHAGWCTDHAPWSCIQNMHGLWAGTAGFFSVLPLVQCIHPLFVKS